MSRSPEFVTISNLIVDDIVLSDGRSFMNTLGGAGTHTLVGMRPWCDALGFVAYCGDDLDPQHRAFLEQMGVDLRGVVVRPGRRTARAWQLFEPDELRIEIFRTSIDEFRDSKPEYEDIPEDYRQARGFHLQWGTTDELVALIGRLRAANPSARMICEPTLPSLAGSLDANLPLLRSVDVFSPDRDESRSLLGTSEVPEIFAGFLGAGARIVALRMGAQGSLVGTASGDYYRVPAVPPAELVDVTGAGNAYCGGFLVGVGRGEGAAEAAARAAASASFALEQIGVPRFDEARLAEAERRRRWALDQIVASRDLAELLP